MSEHDPDPGHDAGHTVHALERLTGTILDGRYRIDEKLAAGGFGSIYRALDLVMGREVALKVLHRQLATDPNVVERFRREAGALARLRDPHTITMYDVGESTDGTRYIVMELLRGESLHAQFLAHGTLPWRRVVRIARGVCSSLREAHAVGIVHRDLKPANIHLEQHALESDFVKVLDFGIAKQIDASEPNRDLTLAGQLVGTFDYMPPEQMIGGMCTGKSDVFMLGVVIYEMIAGERPFGEAKGAASMLMQVLGTKPSSLAAYASVPPALDAIVLRALELEPELRPDIFELDEELARILDETYEGDALAAGNAVSFDDTRFDEDEARFGDDDGPTWIEPIKTPPRMLAVRPTEPAHPRPSAPNATLLGAVPPRVTPARGAADASRVTPARGVAIAPRAPAPTEPSAFAVGSRTTISPVSTAMMQRPPAPVRVRFLPQPSVPVADAPIAPPARLPTGTTTIQNEPSGARSAWRDDFIRGFVYALLAAGVAIGIYLML